MTIRKPVALAAFALCLAAPFAKAHEVWLLPSSTVLSSTGYITVDGAVSNDLFYFNYRPMAIRDNLFITAPDGGAVQPENMVRSELRTAFDANLTQPGTYRLAAVNSGVMASWKEGGETKRWRGAQSELATNVPANAAELTVREGVSRVETFVTVGKPTTIVPTGEGLELAPVTHPNDLYAGEAATLGFTINGKPAPGVEVILIPGGTRYRDQLAKVELVTDAQGQVTYTWPSAGFYYLKAGVNDTNTSAGNVERRLSYTATLEVLAQ
nr:DUF4198 domain-containing protein [Zoogloeaceae bacterium]